MTIKNILAHIFMLSFVLTSYNTQGQEVINASLQEVILSAQAESPDYLLAKTRSDNAYWRFVSAKSAFRPQLGLNATLPSINRSINAIPLPDGTEAFVSRSFMRNSVGLYLSQDIVATGGSVFLNSSFDRLDQFKRDSIDGFTQYLTSPINIGFNQPLLQYNFMKWNKRFAELNYETSQKRYVEERESVAFNAMNNFFDVYTTRLSLEEARRNMEYLNDIAENAKGRFEVGRISETDLLQIQLSAKNASSNVARLELNLQNKTEILRDFLGMENAVEFNLTEPAPLEIYIVNKEEALLHAKKNRSATQDFRFQLLQAESELERAQKENGPNLSLSGSFGLTRSSNTFSNSFQNLLDQEGLSLSLDIPIADFGRRKAQREIAKSNLELTQLQVKQNEVFFEREVLVNVEQFELKRDQLTLSEEALEIALKRLDIAKKRYEIGKIDVTNLNIAIQEELSARQQYYATLWDLWRAHYTLRNLTLFDFINGVPLQ